MKQTLAIIFLLFAPATHCMADGKMYWREKIPPKIPYQRALILFKDGTETLLLQSKYEIPKIEEGASIGWVVPIPAVPEVASIRADDASYMFGYLSMESHPRVTRIVSTVLTFLFVGLACVSILTLLFCLLSFIAPLPAWLKENRDKLARYSLTGLLVFLFAALFMPATQGSPGVDVIAEHRVGVYDVRVVKSDDAGDLISWLNENEFQFGEEDETVFSSYLSKGWCFVVANINPTGEHDERAMVSEGLAAPLILRFSHDVPVYPVALTGTGNHETEILIYLAADTKMSCDERLTLRYAGELYDSSFDSLLSAEIEPDGFFKPENLSHAYLCKFKDTLNPSQMSHDITFTTAADDDAYREHIVKW